MRAQRLAAPGRFEAIEAEAPSAGALGAGQVLLKMLAGGICGSDLAKFRGDKGFVLDPGGRSRAALTGFPLHEVVGEVVESRHPEVPEGRRVVGWAVRSDGLAEYVVTDGAEVSEYDAGFDPPKAVLVQSIACVRYAVGQFDPAGARVAILGLGPMGLLFAHALKDAGAAHVIGVDPAERGPAAAALGVDEYVCASSAAWAAGLAESQRPEVVIEAVGHQVSTLQHAVAAAAPEARIVCFGIPDDPVYPLDMEALIRKNLTLAGGVTRQRRPALAGASDYLRRHPELFAELVTGVYPVEEAQNAFELASGDPARRLKIILAMS